MVALTDQQGCQNISENLLFLYFLAGCARPETTYAPTAAAASRPAGRGELRDRTSRLRPGCFMALDKRQEARRVVSIDAVRLLSTVMPRRLDVRPKASWCCRRRSGRGQGQFVWRNLQCRQWRIASIGGRRSCHTYSFPEPQRGCFGLPKEPRTPKVPPTKLVIARFNESFGAISRVPLSS